MSRQTGVVIAILVFAAAVGFMMWKTDDSPAEPAAARVPPKPLAEPVRDTSAPAVAAKTNPAAAVPRVPSPKAPRVEAAPPESAPAAPPTATLHISSDVAGAQVFVDRRYIGVAPVTAEDIAPGTRTINVSAPGYDGVAETIDVVPGPRDVMISLKTIRLDESIPVTHKHGMGSCKGRLIATPDGLRYETDNRNDGFTVPLTGLETFKVDFVAKNLKVKVKGGRSYDFTDPGGKADPLYLFHQAVEKARLKQVQR